MRPDLLLALVAVQLDVDPNLLQALCWVESGHRPTVITLNDGGKKRASIGLCQIQQRSAGEHANLLDPWENARAASAYLKKQLRRYGHTDCALLAYNQGSVNRCTEFDIYDRIRHTEYVKKVRRAMKERPWLTRKVKTDAQTPSTF